MKDFIIDKQTLKDLQIFESERKSVFDYFNFTYTEGGLKILKNLFLYPLTDAFLINERQKKILYLDGASDFPFEKSVIKDLLKYINEPIIADRFLFGLEAFLNSADYYYLKRSVQEAIGTIISLKRFLNDLSSKSKRIIFFDSVGSDIEYILKSLLGEHNSNTNLAKIGIADVYKYDKLIKGKLYVFFKNAIDIIHELDAYNSVAFARSEFSLNFPDVNTEKHREDIQVKGLYHIFNNKSVKNDIYFTRSRNIWFLTGPNMSGKSTIIKALAIAIYLAHLGFPTPTESMMIDVLDGLFTTINIEDNLEMGYSQFYNEALRLKNIVEKLSADSQVLIILDELFKGTNYTDANMATKKVVQYFSNLTNSFVIISSHLLELNTKLEEVKNLQFMHLSADVTNQKFPIFSYKLQSGVANEKLGMLLLEKSGVFKSFDNLFK